MLNQTQMSQIMGKLHLHYGEAWTRKWVGLDPLMLMSEWTHFLGSITPGQIKWALANLPEYPPNATQFRDLCWKAPAGQIQAPPPLAIGAPQDLGDGPEAMARRQAAYLRFKQAMAELYK